MGSTEHQNYEDHHNGSLRERSKRKIVLILESWAEDFKAAAKRMSRDGYREIADALITEIEFWELAAFTARHLGPDVKFIQIDGDIFSDIERYAKALKSQHSPEAELNQEAAYVIGWCQSMKAR